MPRLLPTLLVLALLAATATAFAVTERLKLEKSPIAAPRIDRVFSPVCACRTRRARISFRLRRPDTIRLAIVDSKGRVVRRLVASTHADARRFGASWDGRDDAGALVPEGVYRPRLHLARGRRTIDLPNPIRVDLTPPRIRLVEVAPRAFSPDGDGRNDKISARYRVSEPARVRLFVGDVRRVRKRGQRAEGKVDWFGRVSGRSLPAGRYRISLRAFDLAGNLSARTPAAVVTIRYIGLGRDQIRARTRTRFGVRVLTDARRFRWRFAGGTGTAAPGLLVLRAPRRPGRYTLFVETNGHAARATVLVRLRPRPGSR